MILGIENQNSNIIVMLLSIMNYFIYVYFSSPHSKL